MTNIGFLFLFLQIFSPHICRLLQSIFFQWFGLTCLARSKATMTEVYIRAFYFLGFRIKTRWARWKLLVPISVTAVCTAMVRTINLCEEVCFNMDDNDTILFPIYIIRAYGRNIPFFLNHKREVNSVVYMARNLSTSLKRSCMGRVWLNWISSIVSLKLCFIIAAKYYFCVLIQMNLYISRKW